MKLTNFGFLLVLLATVISCTQSDEISQLTADEEFSYDVESKIQYPKINVLTKGFAGARGSEQLLVFPDKETFISTVNELERQVEELDDAYNEFYKELNEEEINAKMLEIGFNEELPLLEFLKEIGFNSLYNQLVKEEEEWLKQDELDFANDPDDHFIDGDNYRALFNTDGEVKVGESIYKITPDGYFQIVDGDIESLKLLEDISIGRLTLPKNIIFVGDEYGSDSRINSSDCKTSKAKSDKRTSGNRRIKWKVKHATPFLGSRQVYAETTNYKKGGIFGNDWVKYKTYCEAQVYGYVAGTPSASSCVNQVDFNPLQGIWVEYNKKSVKHKIFVETKTKSGWVKGNHYGAGGIEYSSTLTW